MIAEIVFENEKVLILNKASGVHSLRGRDSSSPNLQDWLESQRPSQAEVPDSGLLQRLDYLTSGCILIAKDQSAYEDYGRKVKRKNFFEKIYLAITTTKIPNQSLSFYFQSRYRSSKKISVSHLGDPKDLGTTEIELMDSGQHYFIYRAKIIGAGKRHQIRASFAAMGAPLSGDLLYRGEDAPFFGLHSWRLICPDFEAVARPSFASFFSLSI